MNQTHLALRRRQRQNLALAFVFSLAVVVGAYALLGFVPFGDGTMLTGDLNGLYVNYITDFWRRARQGGLGYSFAKLAGGSTLGLFAYYMNSPFNLLYLLFPVRAIPWAAQLMFALRTALTGVTACFYLGRHFGSASRLLPAVSAGYSLCAFCVVYSQNILWMDVVLLAPLLLWAVDALLAAGRHWPLTGLVLAAALCNFYTAWELCLFCLLYFFRRAGRGAGGRFAGARFAGGGAEQRRPVCDDVFAAAAVCPVAAALPAVFWQLFLERRHRHAAQPVLRHLLRGADRAVFCRALSSAGKTGRGGHAGCAGAELLG